MKSTRFFPSVKSLTSEERRENVWREYRLTLVDGIRALLNKDPDVLDRVAEEESADVVVLQETKLQAGSSRPLARFVRFHLRVLERRVPDVVYTVNRVGGERW